MCCWFSDPDIFISVIFVWILFLQIYFKELKGVIFWKICPQSCYLIFVFWVEWQFNFFLNMLYMNSNPAPNITYSYTLIFLSYGHFINRRAINKNPEFTIKVQQVSNLKWGRGSSGGGQYTQKIQVM